MGLRLRAVAKPAAAPAPRFQWLRCPAELPRSCEPIAGATRSSYVVEAADVGRRLAVRARRRGARRVSALTIVVPHPYALPVPPEFMQPFPVVRLKGSLTRRGADIALLRVRGRATPLVRVRCTGPSCPLRRLAPPPRPDQAARALPGGRDPDNDPRDQPGLHREVRAHHDP